MSARAESQLGPLFALFADAGVEARPVVYSDDAIDDVASELKGLDGVLVWVNPIQDGANRSRLDALLRQTAADGLWVSAHPDVVDKMGTKEVLFTTQQLGWGSDTAIYRSPEELAQRFPARLSRHGRLVIKQARGNGGIGVWRVELPSSGETVDLGTTVLVQRSAARTVTPLEPTTLGDFVDDCRACFAWSGSVIDQPYQERLAEGMIRVYFVQAEVVGFCHQWPKGLLTPGANEPTTAPPRPAPSMEDADTPAYSRLRASAESEWVPAMMRLLDLTTDQLPVIWDADFLYGPKTDAGDNTYVLCEINVQAVWPYPPQASRRLVQAAVEATLASKLPTKR